MTLTTPINSLTNVQSGYAAPGAESDLVDKLNTSSTLFELGLGWVRQDLTINEINNILKYLRYWVGYFRASVCHKADLPFTDMH